MQEAGNNANDDEIKPKQVLEAGAATAEVLLEGLSEGMDSAVKQMGGEVPDLANKMIDNVAGLGKGAGLLGSALTAYTVWEMTSDGEFTVQEQSEAFADITSGAIIGSSIRVTMVAGPKAGAVTFIGGIVWNQYGDDVYRSLANIRKLDSPPRAAAKLAAQADRWIMQRYCPYC